uniref:Uncharacterized protein n=1 Tax=Cacopsylla melanoneura TaxID=428564 RepID=A0A8D9E4I2_9HEMI
MTSSFFVSGMLVISRLMFLDLFSRWFVRSSRARIFLSFSSIFFSIALILLFSSFMSSSLLLSIFVLSSCLVFVRESIIRLNCSSKYFLFSFSPILIRKH